MVWLLRLLVVSVVLTVAAVGIGTFVRTPHHPATTSAPPTSTPTTTPTTTPLAESLSSVDTATISVQRAPFCDRLAPDDLAAALGGRVQHSAPYSAGQKARVGGVRDVVDEYGCQWSAAGAQARAWVFAAAVTPQWARSLSAQVPHGCRPVHDIQYGAPTAALRCGDSLQLRGLFGDAWLTCELTTRDVDLAGRFCLAVARAAQ